MAKQAGRDPIFSASPLKHLPYPSPRSHGSTSTRCRKVTPLQVQRSRRHVPDVNKIPMTGQERRRLVRQQERRVELERLARLQSDEVLVKRTAQRVVEWRWSDVHVMQRQFRARVLIPSYEISTLLRELHIKDVLSGEDGDWLGGIGNRSDG
jgi:hypothetical protein